MPQKTKSKLDEILEFYERGNPHATVLALYNARKNPEAVNKWGLQDLANAEHSAFTYGLMRDNPLWALPMSVAIPGYDIAKRLGIQSGRSQPGFDQMGAAYQGLWRGLLDEFRE